MMYYLEKYGAGKISFLWGIARWWQWFPWWLRGFWILRFSSIWPVRNRMELPEQKSRRYWPMGLFMQDGPRHGQHFGWRRKSGQKNVPNRMRSPAHAASMLFPIGKPNDAFAQYFTGQNYLAPVSADQVGIFNVAFEPGCRNNWHIHHAKSGEDRFWFVSVAGDIIRSGGKKRRNYFPVM